MSQVNEAFRNTKTKVLVRRCVQALTERVRTLTHLQEDHLKLLLGFEVQSSVHL